jgi:hypothetical protein
MTVATMIMSLLPLLPLLPLIMRMMASDDGIDHDVKAPTLFKLCHVAWRNASPETCTAIC